jgi:hypothetical protein
MKHLFISLWLVAAGLGRLVAAHPPIAVDALPAQWKLSLDAFSSEHPDQAFRAEADGVYIEGRFSFDSGVQMLRLQGVYRTRQELDPRAKLSYQLYSDEGKVLQADGRRFEWRASAAGGVEADFLIESVLIKQPKLRSVVRVQFNYVVEHEYWYRDRHPELFLPELALSAAVRSAQLSVRWAWVPPVLPSETVCIIPAWIGAEFAGKPPPYSAALDVLASGEGGRVEALRQPLPLRADGECLVLYGLEEASRRSVQLRPGFVWEGVEWFDSYRSNPYREVRVVGPLSYVFGLTFAMLGLVGGWCGLQRVRSRRLRWAGYGVWGVAGLWLVAVVAVSFYAVVALGIALIWWLQRRIAAPGSRAYWTLWCFLVMLELYWGHGITGSCGHWTGTFISACLAALVLLPLRCLQRPWLAASAGTAIGLIAALGATAMAVYFGFFHDYPGLRDLLYAGQVGAVGDSVAILVGQRHLVPWLLCACSVSGLWRGTVRAKRPNR